MRPRRLTPVLRRALRAARRVNTWAVEMRNLSELTRRTLQMDLAAQPGERLASHIHQLFELEAVALFDADLHEVYKAGKWSADPVDLVQNVYHFETTDDDRSTGISRRVVRLGSVPIGSLVMRGNLSAVTYSAIADVIAITFDRYRATANENRIEAEREAEQLRVTVLDNLAHEYKTPLTAIRAASSGLREMGRLSPSQAELVGLIDEQATLLADLTTRLLTTARLESGSAGGSGPDLRLERVAAESLIEEVIAGLRERADGAAVRVELPSTDLSFCCDRRLMNMLLSQYLDNAFKYSDAGRPITIKIAPSTDEILISVHSFGPAIPVPERERIFDRYYRSSTASSRASGTGIGLSIAKRVALAHGGSVWVLSDPRGGNTFFAAIPARLIATADPLPPDQTVDGGQT